MFISLVNLIIWLEKKTSITNKAKKKNTNNDLMKKMLVNTMKIYL
jgi:hypothetical protein